MIAKLKRIETWDRVLVAFVAFGLLWSTWAVATSVPRIELEFDFFAVQAIVWMLGYLGLHLYSLRAIWLHRRPGFVILLVLHLISIAGWLAYPTPWGFWTWLYVTVIALYCGLRAYQLRRKPQPPPLPQA